MARLIEFTKMVASGNDFVLIWDASSKPQTARLKKLAQAMCDRKYGIGSDGLLVLGKSNAANVRMRIFNADGSEAQMCGNGARCSALWAQSKTKNYKKIISIETKAGIIESGVNESNVKIKLTDPKDIKLNISVTINGRTLKVNFINTGVPHVVIFVEGLDALDVDDLGRAIRYHHRFLPAGTNVNFVEMISDDFIKVRTYERGVEGETLACGTGAVASAIVTGYKLGAAAALQKIKILTRGTEVLKVYFERINDKFSNIWLSGKAYFVFNGRFTY